MKVHEKLYIGGEWVDPATKAVIDVISPHTEEVVGRVPEASTADVDRAVGVARATFDDGDWPRLTPEERIAAVQRFADAYVGAPRRDGRDHHRGDGLADHVLATSASRPRRG